jgi:glycosyltransferase involved in cell wall biosynthesis
VAGFRRRAAISVLIELRAEEAPDPMAAPYALIIPALNEAESMGQLLPQIPSGLFTQIIVVDNGSRDATADVARAAGAQVITEARHGYGRACQAGLVHLQPDTQAVAFMDADLSDDPSDLLNLARCLEDRELDLVIGSRVLGSPEAGSLTFLQRFGNWLSTRLILWIWDVPFTDLGPLRMIRRDALRRLDLRDHDFGWNVEMQAKAARLRLRVGEIPVNYRRRKFGRSKISGTLASSTRAGIKILLTMYRCWRLPRPPDI